MKNLLFLWKNISQRFFLLQITLVTCISTKGKKEDAQDKEDMPEFIEKNTPV